MNRYTRRLSAGKWARAGLAYAFTGAAIGFLMSEARRVWPSQPDVLVEVAMLIGGLIAALLSLRLRGWWPRRMRDAMTELHDIAGLIHRDALLTRIAATPERGSLAVFVCQWRHGDSTIPPMDRAMINAGVRRQIASLLQSSLRSEDVLATLGGLEFAVWMPHTRRPIAHLLVEWTTTRLGHTTFRHGPHAVAITAAHGLTETKDAPERTLEVIRKAACRRARRDQRAARADAASKHRRVQAFSPRSRRSSA